ncbi:MAG: four helix bundle protein [Pseudomonadota bacterium]
MLDHERLDVYQCAIDYLVISVKVMEAIPKGHGSLADQLKRASWSIPLNIAEGCGKTGPADKQRFYAIARGSAMECAAVMDVCGVLQIANPKLLKEGKILLTRVVAMLTKMCRSTQ